MAEERRIRVEYTPEGGECYDHWSVIANGKLRGTFVLSDIIGTGTGWTVGYEASRVMKDGSDEQATFLATSINDVIAWVMAGEDGDEAK